MTSRKQRVLPCTDLSGLEAPCRRTARASNKKCENWEFKDNITALTG